MWVTCTEITLWGSTPVLVFLNHALKYLVYVNSKPSQDTTDVPVLHLAVLLNCFIICLAMYSETSLKWTGERVERQRMEFCPYKAAVSS